MGNAQSELRTAIRQSKSALVAVAWLSAIINVLLLGGPIYMLLIYDSVMPSGSTATLFGLLAMVVVVYTFQGLFDLLRIRILGDVAAALDSRMTGRVHGVISQMALKSDEIEDDGLAPMRDLDAIRSFLSSPGPGALMDLPWLLLFIGLLTALHIWLGVTALVGAIILVSLTLLNDRRSREPSQTLSVARGARARLARDNRRHVEVIRALGMGERMYDAWHSASVRLGAAQDQVTRTGSLLSGISRIFRLFLQSVVLTVGALLYLGGEASGGIVFAASILAARALAPIDQVIAHWGGFMAARQGWERLERLFEAMPETGAPETKLPAPKESLRVEGLTIMPPGCEAPVLEEVQFSLEAGEALGIVGPSAAGKTTLIKSLVGLWTPTEGSVRLDGASLDQWEPDDLGQHLGYLPQHVELFEGTLAQNIARFDPAARSDTVIAAAQAAGVHDMILALPGGYDSLVGEGALLLSAGQRQRVGLARALYGNPFLVALDEPNSNLDADGEAALDAAIASCRARGAIVVLVAHRPSALRQVNRVLVLRHGRLQAIGQRDEILARLMSPAKAAEAEPEEGIVDSKPAEAHG